MKITVTKTDIKRGKRKTMTLCPVALAIKRKYNDHAWVYPWGTTVGIDQDAKCGPLPRSAQRFIRRFDTRMPVKPFSFMLELR